MYDILFTFISIVRLPRFVVLTNNHAESCTLKILCSPLHALCDVGEGPEHLRQLGRVEFGRHHLLLLLLLLLASTATVLIVVKLKA